jgi:hypothetical protein
MTLGRVVALMLTGAGDTFFLFLFGIRAGDVYMSTYLGRTCQLLSTSKSDAET